MKENFDFDALVDLCRRTHEHMQRSAARAANTALAARNWLFGWYIVEYEQEGADRAEYGERLIARLSAALTDVIGKGFSERNLDQFRKFYRLYREIPQTASAELGIPETLSRMLRIDNQVEPSGSDASLRHGGLEISQTLSAEFAVAFRIGWSHYVELLTLDAPDELAQADLEDRRP